MPSHGILEQIIGEIVEHDEKYPDHGVYCNCMDKHRDTLRTFLNEKYLYYPSDNPAINNSRINLRKVLLKLLY